MAERAGSRLTLQRWLCSALSPRVAAAAVGERMPQSDQDWARVLRTASAQMVLPKLYLALRHKGLLDRLPVDLVEALVGFHELNVVRNAGLRQQMVEVSGLLNRGGVRPVWLKGATCLMPPDGAASGRMMLDLDFWLPDGSSHERALACLHRAGYAVPRFYDGYDFSHHHHYAPLMKEGEPARLEVHRQIVPAALSPQLDNHEALRTVECFTWEGLEVARLSAPDRAMHAFAQCLDNDESFARGELTLMKLLDFAERVDDAGWTTPPPEWAARLDRPPWRHRARALLSFLERDFRLPSPLPRDGGYLRRLAWPRAYFGVHIVQLIVQRALSGQAGHPRTWLDKLARRLQTLKQIGPSA